MQMHVEIEFMTRGKEVVAQALRQALQEAWKALPQELFDLKAGIQSINYTLYTFNQIYTTLLSILKI